MTTIKRYESTPNKAVWRLPTTFDLGLSKEEITATPAPGEGVNEPARKTGFRVTRNRNAHPPAPPPDRAPEKVAMNQHELPVIWYVLDMGTNDRGRVQNLTNPSIVYDQRQHAALMLTATRQDMVIALLIMPAAIQRLGYTAIMQHFTRICETTGITGRVLKPDFLNLSRAYFGNAKTPRPADLHKERRVNERFKGSVFHVDFGGDDTPTPAPAA